MKILRLSCLLLTILTAPVLLPAAETAPRELVALVGVTHGESLQFLAQPDPLRAALVVPHSADTDRDLIMSAIEAKEYGIIDEILSTRDLASVGVPAGVS